MENAKFDGEKLKEIRLNCNLTQLELAEIVNTTQNQISRFEKGQQPKFATLSRLAKALQVETEDLFYYSAKY